MKPGFTLSLSIGGIELLHDSAEGRESLGSVAPDAPDLIDALARLRERACGISPGGIATRVLIPNSQIRYMALDSGPLDDDARQQFARKALDGATPYAVEELVIDTASRDGVTHIAAVARETLEEARIFADQHGFNPRDYLAIPDPDDYPGEVVFDLNAAPAPVDGTGTGRDDASHRDEHDTDEVAQFVSRRTPQHRFAPEEPPATDGPRLTLTAGPDGPAPHDPPAHAGGTEPPPDPDPETTPAPAIRSEPEPQTEPRPEPADETAWDHSQDIDTVAPEPVAPPPAPKVVAAPPLPVTPPEDETERMTLFGERAEQRIGGKPRYLGIALTVLLLIFLVAVAAWAAVSPSSPLSGLFNAAPDETELAAEPDPPTAGSGGVTPDQIAAMPAPEILEQEPFDVAASLPETLETDAQQPDIAELDTATLEAAGIHAVTPAAPSAPQGPDEDIYVVSIDPADLSQDAVALAAQPAENADTAPDAAGTPAIPGLVVEFDDRGLVTPTADGTLTPDGVTVYLGKPPVVPPSAPQRAPGDETDDAEPPKTEEELRQERLAGLRPRNRPSNLAELNERGRLGGHSVEELAGLRPRARPITEKQVVEEKDETPTAQAVVASLRPDARPRNFEALVRRASPSVSASAASPASTAAAKPAQNSGASGASSPPSGGRDGDNVATFAPRTVKPSAPSPASVARQATLNNAINLKRVNLIGVYGTPSKRRALIRLPSGRYSKVKVGDRIDGGKVVAIGNSELRYQKGNRTLTLKMPRS
ncbi:hypothetical protein [Pukyongiella litopenaei]|uniref:Type IV pilus biogenesis protein PilP n=1 Tax=Pukyongiella litopenaei TaxID=2605946 RepID=A0A2S0ML48_9RHOB|nr:hypothetical protein [Pukyongiella litopenaei]AVO36413.1 hypothetical protein C6Y53_00940 [Pukyongiella litopenaei]